MKRVVVRLLLRAYLLLAWLTLRLSCLFFILHWVMNTSNMSRVKSSPEAPSEIWCICVTPPFFGGCRRRLLCTYPFSTTISQENVEASLRSIELLVLP
jgi:hypothetical protein